MRLSEIQKNTIVVNEKRKNPDQNPKIPIGIAVRDHLDNAKTIPETRVKNSFVSFTKIEKLGINPRSEYDTPLGIYAYPSEYAVSVVGERNPMSDLPFTGDGSYGNIFSVRGNIIDLTNMTESDYQKYVTAIIDFTVENKQIRKGSDEWKKQVDCLDDVIRNAVAFPQFSSPGGKLWFLTMHVAYKPRISGMKTKNGSVAWNKLFRSIGIDGCIDMGTGIIHTHEETQAVFFSMKSILDVVRYDNKAYVSSPEVLFKAYEMLTSKKSLNPSVIQNLEDSIATSAKHSYWYALDVLGGRFEKGEDAIATSAEYSYLYARDVLKGERVEKIEDGIATSVKHSYHYAYEILDGERFEKGEDAIATDAEYSYEYAKHVLKGERFEKGEDAIATHAYYSCWYAYGVLKGKRFIKGEDAIATHAYYSYYYAISILDRRFEKGEPAIRGSEYQEQYEQLFGIKL